MSKDWSESLSRWSGSPIISVDREKLLKARMELDDPKRAPYALVEDPYALTSRGPYKERRYSVSFDILKQIPQQLAIVSAILQTRCNQIGSFSVPYRNSKSVGFQIRHKNPGRLTTAGEREFILELEDFIARCGSKEPNHYDMLYKRDDFETFLKKIVRDSLTLDQLCFEIVPDRQGIPFEFLAVDASSIRLAAFPAESDAEYLTRPNVSAFNNTYQTLLNERGYKKGKPLPRYVQLLDNAIVNLYNTDELAFGVRNPRTDLRVYGYGQSELEMMINTVTSHLNAEQYNSRFFTQGSMPRGLLNIKGDGMTPDQEEAFKRMWKETLEGVDNAHRTPVLQQEGGVEWINLHTTNREMEYGQWMEYLIKISCFTPETRVVLGDGSARQIKDILPGDEVKTHLGNTKQVKNLQISQHIGNVCCIRAGNMFRVTEEHPLLVTDDPTVEPTFVEARKVRKGAYMCIPKNVHVKGNIGEDHLQELVDLRRYDVHGKMTSKPSTSTSKAHARLIPKKRTALNGNTNIKRYVDTKDLRFNFLLGAYAGKGSGANKAGIVIRCNKYDIGAFCVRTLGEFCRDQGVRLEQLPATENSAKVVKLTTFVFSSLVQELCGYDSNEMRVPVKVWNGDDSVKKAFASGALTGAGMLLISDHNGLALPHKSATFLDDLSMLLATLGVHSSVRPVKAPKGGPSINATVTDTSLFPDKTTDYALFIQGKELLKVSEWIMGPLASIIQQNQIALEASDDSACIDTDKYILVPVTTVTRQEYKGLVYNIEVEDDNSYCIENGLAVHNCAVYQIDPAEINFDMHGGVQQTPLFESSSEWKLKSSKDKGLKPLLRFLARQINDNIISKIDDNFVFDFVGLDELTEQEKHTLRMEQVGSYMTLNEVRRAEDLPDTEGGEMILNPTYIQALQTRQQLADAEKAAEAQEEGEGGEAVQPTEPRLPAGEEENSPAYADGFSKGGKILEFSLDDWLKD